jgi:Zn-dependent protease with chaperone function
MLEILTNTDLNRKKHTTLGKRFSVYFSRCVYNRDLHLIKNLVISSLVCVVVVIFMHITLSKATYYSLYFGDRKNEEIVWYIIKDNFVQDKNGESDYYYQVFQEYVQEMVNELPVSILPNDYKISIQVIDDPSINAFAAPGGRIILTRGLLDNIKSENGLMFVVGHEIGHLHNKDHLREFARSLSATVISVLHFGGSLNVQDFLLLFENHNSRSSENIADQWGLKVILARYGHVGGATEFFSLMNENLEEVDNELAALLSSHPSNIDRIKAIQETIKQNLFPIQPLSKFE